MMLRRLVFVATCALPLMGQHSVGESVAHSPLIAELRTEIASLEPEVSEAWSEHNWCKSIHLIDYIAEGAERIISDDPDVLYTQFEYEAQLQSYAQAMHRAAEENEHIGLSHFYLIQGLQAARFSDAWANGQTPETIADELRSDLNCGTDHD